MQTKCCLCNNSCSKSWLRGVSFTCFDFYKHLKICFTPFRNIFAILVKLSLRNNQWNHILMEWTISWHRISSHCSQYLQFRLYCYRISGKWNRIFGRILDIQKGRISGWPDIRYNPNNYHNCCLFSDIHLNKRRVLTRNLHNPLIIKSFS